MVDGVDFELWERQGRAVHARGAVRAIRGGSRVEMRFVLTARTRALIAVFFVLYVVAAYGLAEQGPHGLSATSFVVAFAGFVVIAGIFLIAARSQRAQLREFVSRVFAPQVDA